jgi:potassium efflux system protein
MLRVLALLVLFVTAPAWGQGATVSEAQLDGAVERVSSNLAEDDPQRASLLKYYADTRAALSSLAQFNQAWDGYTRARDNAQAEAQSIEAALAGAQGTAQKADESLQDVSLSELEQEIQVDKSALAALKGRLVDINAALNAMPGRATDIRARLTELGGLLAELDSQLSLMNKTAEPGSEDEARLWLAQAESADAAAEKAALDEEMLSQPMRQDLLIAQRDKANYDITALEKHLAGLEAAASILRQGEAEQAQAEAELVLAGTEGKHELVQQLADENAALTASFSERGAAIESIQQQEAAARKRAEQLEADLASIQRKLKVVGMTTAVGEILREQAVQLPSPRESKKSIASGTRQITQSSLHQIELEDERRQLRNRDRFIARRLEGQDDELIVLIGEDLGELALTRRELIRQAVDLEGTYAQALGDLDFTLRRYAGAVDHYRKFISERMLWIPSRETLSLFRGTMLPGQLAEVFAPGRWILMLQAVPGELMQQPLTLVGLTLVLLLVYFTPRLLRRLQDTGKKVGYVHTDLFSDTLQALGITFVLALRWPLLVLLLAWLFEMQEADSELANAVYVALASTSLYFWGLEFLRLLLLPKGLAESHFRWPTSRNTSLWRRIVRFEQTLLPAVFLVSLSVVLYPREVGGPIGALGVVAVLLSISHFFRRIPQFVQGKMDTLFRDNRPRDDNSWGAIIRQVLIWVPIIGIGAVLFGYTYTAVEFALLLIETVVLYSVMMLFHELGLRWLRLARRRMIVKVRQEMAQTSDEDHEVSADDEILENDPELLNDEGTKLLNAMLVIAGVVVLVAIWAEVFPALAVLNSVELWHQTAMIDGREATIPVTLADVFYALTIAVLGWVALRRIPSLLEILLRQRMRIPPANAYAATRVFQYGATTILVVTVLSTLGGSWSQIQWAVAALSVGIGFGLQEIVANFISGLIILFEQPIRLGDTVTVGDVSGKVTKIRIRATTIRDFDRRELLVPNKEFITNQLLNWSLSDQVTRRLLEVGVAYGTDMDKAMEIVREVAQAHPLVLVDPESMITFDEFGDNSLLISLRFFLDQLEQRLIVSSDMRLEINRRFNEAGIVVAFPQRDIHLDASEPLRVTMVEQGAAT